MSIKNELILSYIKELDVGTKISVRRLSEILNVSVGTVYKAIKAAEAQGLVVTKPKSGTFKIDSGVIGEAEPVSLKRAAKMCIRDRYRATQFPFSSAAQSSI